MPRRPVAVRSTVPGSGTVVGGGSGVPPTPAKPKMKVFGDPLARQSELASGLHSPSE